MSATSINFVWQSSARILAIADLAERQRKAVQLWELIDRRATDCEVLWSILSGVIPAAFADPADVNSIIRDDADDTADDDNPEYAGLTCTYSPEDNKLRLYAQSRLSKELYARVKAAGFAWAPKQELFVAPGWTPARENLLLELCGEIGDEDYSPEERAADRAERFSGYRDKRRAEAHSQADRFDAGPTAFGHQSRTRAERQAARHDRLRGRAVSQWSKAEYWQQRTEGVISHALFKSSPEVRRGRILRLEAELRGLPAASRWAKHIEFRLTYERAMLQVEGGSASDNDMEPGGWIGHRQIHGVNKSPVTKRVTSVKLWCSQRYGRPCEPYLKSYNIERMAADVYHPPTDEERAAFATTTKARKETAKATKPAAPALINPTDEDAQKLQDIWNAQALADHKRRGSEGELPVSTVSRMTQAEYSENSKGTYTHFAAVGVTEKLCQPNQSTMSVAKGGRVVLFKIRKRSTGGFNYAADRVIVITDKPQKPIPWQAVQETRAQQPTEQSMFPRLEELARAGRNNWLPSDKNNPEYQLMADGVYLGWFYIASMSQFGFTDLGNAKYQEFLATTPVEETACV